jgi:hypothetical protein
MSLLPYGVSVIGLLSVVLLGWGLRQLRPYRKAVQNFLGIERIRMLTRGLLFVPLLAVLGLIGAYILFYQGASVIRIAHGTFIFGLWINLTIVFFVLAVISRLSIRPAVQTLAAGALAVPLVAYLTPLARFEDVFAMLPGGVPLCAGLAIMIAG